MTQREFGSLFVCMPLGEEQDDDERETENAIGVYGP
jgi:hypothetical protein